MEEPTKASPATRSFGISEVWSTARKIAPERGEDCGGKIPNATTRA
jgi:hypothetical protein